ncbi:MAG: polyhydroxyalkanoic acid system family protein [Methylovirgula sp.]|jgi:Putative polyhydroxyalkanoic acid system protein (PHA_gran_rgn)
MNSIVVSVPHGLSVAEAHRRIETMIDRLRAAYLDKLAYSEMTWRGDSADIRVIALAQEVKAHIDVLAESVRIEIVLPWILAGLAGPIETRLAATARETLAIGYAPKRP